MPKEEALISLKSTGSIRESTRGKEIVVTAEWTNETKRVWCRDGKKEEGGRGKDGTKTSSTTEDVADSKEDSDLVRVNQRETKWTEKVRNG